MVGRQPVVTFLFSGQGVTRSPGLAEPLVLKGWGADRHAPGDWFDATARTTAGRAEAAARQRRAERSVCVCEGASIRPSCRAEAMMAASVRRRRRGKGREWGNGDRRKTEVRVHV